MIKEQYDNSSIGLNNKEIIELIKNYFETNLPNYKLFEVIDHAPYWGLQFKNNLIAININGDSGFSITIKLNTTEYQLWQYDRRVNNAMKTNIINLTFQLKVLNEFLLDAENTKNK